MDEKIHKIRSARENSSIDARSKEDVSIEQGEIQEASKSVAEVVESVNADEDSGFGEKEHGDKAQRAISGNGASQSSTGIAVLPPIEEMIKQTVAAIEVELQKTREEMTMLLRDKSSSPYTINNKVKRIRFLNGLIADLKRAAKLAEEFIVSLWKQYVKKTG